MNQDLQDEALLSALESDAIEVKCLLLEPQDYVSIYGVLGAGEESPKNNLDMDDIPSRSGMPDLDIAEEGERNILNKDALHMRPNEVEVGNFQVHNDLSGTCEDYLLDVEFSEISSDVDSGSSKGLHASLFKTQLPVASSSKTDSLGLSGPSGAIVRVADYENNILDPTNSALHGISSHDYGCETLVEDKWSKSPNSFTMHNFDKLEDVSGLLTDHVCSDKDDTDMFLCPGLTCGGTFSATIKEYGDSASAGQDAETESPHKEDVLSKSSNRVSSADFLPTQKRPRKPTRRYVDESAELMAISFNKRKRVPSATSKDKFPRDKCEKDNHTRHGTVKSKCEKDNHTRHGTVKSKCEKDNHTRHGTVKSFPEESSAKPIQVPFGPLVGGECSKTHTSSAVRVPDSDDESSMDESESNSATKVRSEEDRTQKVRSEEDRVRRKHHRLWTIAEVKKLIEGVAQYGVGKWSDIKSQYFPSSQHRTPVDLKDKWRNLLKASRLQTGGDNKRNLSWRPLPKSVLNRVNELANVYPYPRILKSKVSHVQHISSPIPINGNTGALPNNSRRNLNRKSGT